MYESVDNATLKDSLSNMSKCVSASISMPLLDSNRIETEYE